MLWITTDENEFYKNTQNARQLLLERILLENPHYKKTEIEPKLQNILYIPEKEDIKKCINEHNSKIDATSIVSPFPPTYYNFPSMGFFTEVIVRGEHFPHTKEQIDLGVPVDVVTASRIGLIVIRPKMTIEDMVVGDVLKRDVEKMIELEGLGRYVISALFFFGVPGSGKTYFAECFAGSTGRLLVILDLPHFMSLPNPTRAVDDMFDALMAQKNQKFLLLIDEIEKMFSFGGDALVAQQVFGKMLTRLNDIYGKEDSNITVLATSNNITKIMDNNPEFLRRGRFNRLYFMNYPSRKTAEGIYNLYIHKNKRKLAKMLKKEIRNTKNKKLFPYIEAIKKGEISPLQFLEYIHFDMDSHSVATIIDEHYFEAKQSGKNFVYVPPEIQAITEELQDAYELYLFDEKYAGERINIDRIKSGDKPMTKEMYQAVKEAASVVVPLQISAESGVSKQLAQAKSYRKSAQIQQFIEVS